MPVTTAAAPGIAGQSTAPGGAGQPGDLFALLLGGVLAGSTPNPMPAPFGPTSGRSLAPTVGAAGFAAPEITTDPGTPANVDPALSPLPAPGIVTRLPDQPPAGVLLPATPAWRADDVASPLQPPLTAPPAAEPDSASLDLTPGLVPPPPAGAVPSGQGATTSGIAERVSTAPTASATLPVQMEPVDGHPSREPRSRAMSGQVGGLLGGTSPFAQHAAAALHQAGQLTHSTSAPPPLIEVAPVDPVNGLAPLDPALDGIEGFDGLRSQPNGASAGADPSPARAPAAPPTAQITLQIAKAAPAQIDRLLVQLEPADLGRVEVRLEFGRDNQISALIAADRPETLEALQRDARALERSLSEAGLNLDADGLNFTLRQDQQQQQPEHHGERSARSQHLAEAAGAPPADAAPSHHRVNLQLLDISV